MFFFFFPLAAVQTQLSQNLNHGKKIGNEPWGVQSFLPLNITVVNERQDSHS